MSITDPIADFLVSLRNSSLRGKGNVITPFSKLKISILRILKAEGFIDDYILQEDKIIIKLKYYDREPAIRNVKRVSKPSWRIYVGKDQMPEEEGNRVWIVSTSEGIMNSKECNKNGIGGELICYVE